MSNNCEAPRHRGTGARTALALALSVSLCLGAPVPRLLAQVGYDPQRSPFRDVTTHQTVSTFATEFFGNRGVGEVGAQAGQGVGLRFATTLSGPIDMWVTFAGIDSRRLVLNPNQPDTARLSGPVPLRLIAADLGLGLNLTGERTWHGLVPYIGASFGVVAPTQTVTDTGGFQATSHIVFVPTAGTQMRIGRALSLTVEARDFMIKYQWPSAYFFPTVGSPVLDPSKEKDTQLTHNFSISAGLSFHFNF